MFLLQQNLIHSPFAGRIADYPFLAKLKVAGIHIIVIPWNILLALLPAVIGAYILKKFAPMPILSPRKRIYLGLLLILWLLLFPNSIYLIMEARQILDYAPRGLPYKASLEHIWKVPLIFAYTLFGWIGFFLSLSLIRRFITSKLSRARGIVTIIVLVPLGTLGAFLGLFNRWNIWEAFSHPVYIFKDALAHISDPIRLLNLAIISMILYLLYFIGELLIRSCPSLFTGIALPSSSNNLNYS